ncbi:MAG: dTDP-4-dehydrorhamnose 3,5-epimerase [Flavobacteriaceae bacterium]
MTATPTLFKEVLLLQPEKHRDNRGSFTEGYNQKVFAVATGLQLHFCQDNYTTSKKGVLRGLHYQLPPYSQSKLVTVLEGRVLDVVVDVRKGSPTFGRHFSQELSAENGLQLFIPRGFAHGYITLSETSLFMYKVDQYYHPESEGSIAPEDPELGIDWKLPQSEWILSDKDRHHPLLKDSPLFDYKDAPYA